MASRSVLHRFIGRRTSDCWLTSMHQISVKSKTEKHDPTYYLTIETKSPASPTPDSRQIRTPFTTWFTADGFFVAKPLQQWLASSIEVIGDVDSKHALRDERDDLAAPSPEFEIKAGAAETTGAESTGKSTTKRSKRKG